MKEETAYIPARIILGIMVFSGFFINYMMLVNFSIALVAMVQSEDDSNLASTLVVEECQPADHSHRSNNSSLSLDSEILNTDSNRTHRVQMTGEYPWNEYTQGIILGAFYWGNAIFQVPGGRLAEVFGTKVVYGCSVFICGLLSLLIPISAGISFYLLAVIRFMQGLCQGVTFPSVHPLTVKWIPENGRNKWVASSYLGGTFGTVVTFPFCGIIIDWLGWRAVFYITGSLALLWCLVWTILVFDSPEQHPRISKKEKNFINKGLGQSAFRGKSLPVPWFSLLTSVPVWAIVMAEIGNSYGLYMLIAVGPTYMRNVMGFNIKQNGFLSSLPYLCRYLCAILFGHVADIITRRNLLRTVTNRKLMTVISHYGPALCMVFLAHSGCNPSMAITLITASYGMNGALTSGFLSSSLDIVPNFSGTVFGLCCGTGSLCGTLAPIITGLLINNNQTIGQWSSVFYIGGAIYFVTCTFFLIFGTGKIQHWNDTGQDMDEENAEKNEIRKELQQESN